MADEWRIWKIIFLSKQLTKMGSIDMPKLSACKKVAIIILDKLNNL